MKLPIFGTIIGIVLILITPTVFAQDFFQFTPVNEGIVCGNNACEELSAEIQIGQEKRIQLGNETYAIKLVRIEKIPQTQEVIYEDGRRQTETYYEYKPFISVNGGPALPEEEILQLELRGNMLNFQPIYDEYGQDAEKIVVHAQEPKYCMVPDCGKTAELNIYKRWNLVPLYFFELEISKQRENQKEAFKNSTCKLINFPVIYGYNSVGKEYVRLHLFGMNLDQLYNSLNDFQQRGQVNGQTILNATPFNAVWVYSDSECKLVTEVPTAIADNLLYMLAAMQNQTPYNSATPVAVRQEVPVRQERIAQQPTEPQATQEQPVTTQEPVQQEVVVERPAEATTIQTAPPLKGLTKRASVTLLLQSSNSVSFPAGWNFFMGTNDMTAKTLEEIRGNCTIQRAYLFHAENQSWEKITRAPPLGQAFIFKVTQSCMFGFPEIAPPTLPVGDIPLAIR